MVVGPRDLAHLLDGIRYSPALIEILGIISRGGLALNVAQKSNLLRLLWFVVSDKQYVHHKQHIRVKCVLLIALLLV